MNETLDVRAEHLSRACMCNPVTNLTLILKNNLFGKNRV